VCHWSPHRTADNYRDYVARDAKFQRCDETSLEWGREPTGQFYSNCAAQARWPVCRPQLPKNPLSSTTVTSGLPVIRPEPRNLESLLSALFGKYNSTQSTRSATLRKPIHVSPPASNLLPCSNPHTNRHNRLESPPTLIKYPLNRGRRICNCSRTGAVPATVTAPSEQRHRNQTHQRASPLFAQ